MTEEGGGEEPGDSDSERDLEATEIRRAVQRTRRAAEPTRATMAEVVAARRAADV